MEDRRLLTTIAAGYSTSPDLTPEQIGQLAMGSHVANLSERYTTHFESEEAAEQALQELVTEYWSDLFGQEPVLPTFNFSYLMANTTPEMVDDSTEFFAANHADSTNVRTLGIDEADIAELLPNNVLVAVRDNVASLIDVTDPEDLVRLSGITLEGHQHRFLSHGQTLFVLSEYMDISTGEVPLFGSPERMLTTSVRVFDLTDSASPKETDRIVVRGQVSTARIAADQLILGVQKRIDYPKLRVVSPDVGSEPRFETRDEFLSRISGSLVDSFLPDYSFGSGAEILDQAWQNIGDYHDLQLLISQASTSQTSLLTFDVSDREPTFIDGEVLMGVAESFAYVDEDSYYAITTERDAAFVGGFLFPRLSDGPTTTIYALDFDPEGVSLASFGDVPGEISSSHSMDEFNGTLRVFTTSQDGTALGAGFPLGGGDVQSNLFVLQSQGEALEIIGELADIAPGERQLGAVFDGELAYATTGNVQLSQQIVFQDPLHIIDLSNPESPTEIAELEIPGLVQSLRAIGETHLLGIGWGVRDNNIHRQVTLYDISNATSPVIVQNWTGDSVIPRQFLLNTNGAFETNTRYDPSTGILVLDPSIWTDGTPEVLQIDVDDTEPIRFLGHLPVSTSVRRGNHSTRTFVLEEHVIVARQSEVSAFRHSDLDEASSTLPVFGLSPDFQQVTSETSIVHPLDNDILPQGSKIISATTDGSQFSVSLDDDQRAIVIQLASLDASFTHEMEYTVELPDGSTLSSTVLVQYIATRTSQMEFSDVSVVLSLEATDEDGDPLNEASTGDTFWLTVSAERNDAQDQGIFGGYVDLLFDRQVFEVIEAAPVEPFTNGQFGKRATVTDQGYEAVGGFSDQQNGNPGANVLVQFQIRVVGEVSDDTMKELRAAVSSSTDLENEFLVYGENNRLHPSSIKDAVLQLQVSASASQSSAPSVNSGALASETSTVVMTTDVNRDGMTSAIDALIIINELNFRASVATASSSIGVGAGDVGEVGGNSNNRTSQTLVGEAEYSFEQMDVNQDLELSPIDILIVINRLNEMAATSQAETESEPLSAFNGVDLSSDPLFVSNRFKHVFE